MANNPVGHIPVAYPTVEDGMHSAGEILGSFTGGASLSRNVLIAHTWVSFSAALGKAFPPDGAMHAAPVSLTPEECKALEEFKAMHANPTTIDWNKWKGIAVIVLGIIQKLLG